MLISRATAEGIADGSVTVAYRRWDRPRVLPGGTQPTVVGVIRFGTGEEVDPVTLTEDDAARAGVRSLAVLLRLSAAGTAPTERTRPSHASQARREPPDGAAEATTAGRSTSGPACGPRISPPR